MDIDVLETSQSGFMNRQDERRSTFQHLYDSSLVENNSNNTNNNNSNNTGPQFNLHLMAELNRLQTEISSLQGHLQIQSDNNTRSISALARTIEVINPPIMGTMKMEQDLNTFSLSLVWVYVYLNITSLEIGKYYDRKIGCGGESYERTTDEEYPTNHPINYSPPS